MNRQAGFSLIELVAVIVILGVLATATTNFITFGAQVYVESADRQRVLSSSRFLIERMSRELSNAIPNSVRVSNDRRCMEFVPIKTSGAYRVDTDASLVPILPNAPSDTIDVISWYDQADVANDVIYIYPINAGDVYDSVNNDASDLDALDKVSRILAVTGTSPNYQITLKSDASDTTASADLFSEESPVNRYFTADSSINYCLIANGTTFDMYRFETAINNAQTIPVTLQNVNTVGGVLMAEGITNNVNTARPFTFQTSAQARNAVVSLFLQFDANQSENMFFNHEVHIPNVP